MIRYLSLLLLCGCFHAANPWAIDGIMAGNTSFNSKRLRYLSSQAHPSLQFEFLRIGDRIEAFLSLTRFRLSDSQVKILFTAETEAFEDTAPVHEGRMRVRLSSEATQKLIQSLQDGKKVAILLDGFEEMLDPAQFSGSFSQFASEGYFFENLFKGPLE